MSVDFRRLGSAAVALAAMVFAVPAALPSGPPSAAAAATCDGTANRFRDGLKATLPAHNGSLDCILGPGNRGNAVYYLQLSLNKCNHADTGGVDGSYGTKTRDAIAWIQAANGLTVDGVYGPKTRKVIYWYFSGSTQKCGHWTGA
jgi:peptidoglycan hydrolase-like protein with peptidoglycan-binding domain